MWLKGRAAFEKHVANSHADLFKESVLTTTAMQVKFLKPDVAVAQVSWGMKGEKGADGKPRTPGRAIYTWVLVKEGGDW